LKIHKKTNERSDITYDYIFKSIFGSEENKYFTKRLIELITGIKVEKIEVYQDATLEQYRRNEKTGSRSLGCSWKSGWRVSLSLSTRSSGVGTGRRNYRGSNTGYIRLSKSGL